MSRLNTALIPISIQFIYNSSFYIIIGITPFYIYIIYVALEPSWPRQTGSNESPIRASQAY